MGEIKCLRPSTPIKTVTPQCCIPISFAHLPTYNGYRTVRAERAGLDVNKCQHRSTHMIDGSPYCARHAGIKALEILEAKS